MSKRKLTISDNTDIQDNVWIIKTAGVRAGLNLPTLIKPGAACGLFVSGHLATGRK